MAPDRLHLNPPNSLQRFQETIPNAGTSLGGCTLHPRRGLESSALALILALSIIAAFTRSAAQDEPTRTRTASPNLGKLSGGSLKQAFSGKVESVDLKKKLLHVNTVEGGVTEIFPVKKGVPVSLASGGKLKLTELTPGTNVLVYYELRGDRRTVTEIVVLGASPAEEKKKSPPPS